jgi:hypothetical protein
MRVLKIELNEHIEIIEYSEHGRSVLKYLGIFDSKRQAVRCVKENFKVKDMENHTYEVLENAE